MAGTTRKTAAKKAATKKTTGSTGTRGRSASTKGRTKK
jgi:hypothetical protein